MNFQKIWVEQCSASWTLRERFAVKSALDYLVGEKLLTFRIFRQRVRFRVCHTCERYSLRKAEVFVLGDRGGI